MRQIYLNYQNFINKKPSIIISNRRLIYLNKVNIYIFRQLVYK